MFAENGGLVNNPAQGQMEGLEHTPFDLAIKDIAQAIVKYTRNSERFTAPEMIEVILGNGMLMLDLLAEEGEYGFVETDD